MVFALREFTGYLVVARLFDQHFLSLLEQ